MSESGRVAAAPLAYIGFFQNTISYYKSKWKSVWRKAMCLASTKHQKLPNIVKLNAEHDQSAEKLQALTQPTTAFS